MWFEFWFWNRFQNFTFKTESVITKDYGERKHEVARKKRMITNTLQSGVKCFAGAYSEPTKQIIKRIIFYLETSSS